MRQWDTQVRSYNALMNDISTKVQNAYHLIWTHCHASLQTKILLDAYYKAISAEKEYYKQKNVTTLLFIIKRLCSGPVVVKNSKSTVIERSYSVLLSKGDDYNSLEEYTTVFVQRAEVAEQFGWYFGSKKLCDLCVAESIAHKDNLAFAATLTS